MGLVEALLQRANGTLVSINPVSEVLTGSISALKIGLMLLRARQPFFFTLCLIESKLNLDLFVLDFLVEMWLFSASGASSVYCIGRIN